MSNISRTLSRLAAAQRVSMEAADEAVQGQTGDLNEQELANVAAKAAKKVADDAADKATPAPDGGSTTDDAGTASTDTSDSTDNADKPAEASTDASSTDAPSADDTATTDDTASADAPSGDTPPDTATTDASSTDAPTDAPDDNTDADTPASEIETPAEEELDALHAEQADDTASTDEAGTTDTDTDAAAPTSDAGVTADAPVDGDETQTEAAGITNDDLATAADTGEVAAAAVDQATAADDSAAATADTGEDASAETATTSSTETPTPDGQVDSQTGKDPEDQAEEPKPATAPGAQTDANEAVREVVELTEAVAQASTAEDVVKQARKINDGLSEIAETAEVINENGGVTMESLATLILAARAQAAPLERGDIGFGVSLESFAGKRRGDRVQVSLEEINDVIAELDESQPHLERQAIESLDRVVEALSDALPSAIDRLKSVVSQAQATADTNEGAPVKVGDGLAAALCIDGAFPTDLANELQTYSLLGKCLLGTYSETAFRTAQSASMLVNAVDFSSTSAFWEKVGAVVDGATDPRCTLTATQLEATLPGGASLFGEAQPELESPNPVLKSLIAFNNNYAPLEATVAGKCENDAEATAPALSASKIVLVAKALQDTLCCDKICEVLAAGQKLWPEAQDSIRMLRENLSNAPREIDQNIGADFSQLVKYVETSYSLATWPLVNYLTNAVLTVNAFVLFAERSLKAKVEEPPAVGETSDPVTDAAEGADATDTAGDLDNLPDEPVISTESIGTAIVGAAKTQALEAELTTTKARLKKVESELARERAKNKSTK